MAVSAFASAGTSSLFDRIRESRIEARSVTTTQVGSAMGNDRLVVSHTLGRISEPVRTIVTVQPPARTWTRDAADRVKRLWDPAPGSYDDRDKTRDHDPEDGDRDHHDNHHRHHHHP